MQNSKSQAGTNDQLCNEVDVAVSVRQHNAKPIVVRRLICFLKLWGTSNYYKGIDKPTFWQWLYSWRLGYKTAWKIACQIWS